MNCESNLKFSIDAPTQPAYFADEVELHLPRLGDSIKWKLIAVITYFFGDNLFLKLNSSDAIAASGLSYSLQMKIEPEVFTLKKVRPIHDSETTTKFTSDDFISESGKALNFGELLPKNNFKLVINAKLTVMRPEDCLQQATNVLNDISSADLADFTIQIGDKTWQTHKYILSARCPVFHRMLANKECEEYKKSLLKIEDVSKDVFAHFLHFLYTGRLPDLSLKEASEVLIVADKYDVKELKDKCDEMMVKLLEETDPVHDIFQFAHALNCSEELKVKACRFVKSSVEKNFNKIVQSDEWIEKPEVVKELDDKLKEIDEMLHGGVTKIFSRSNI